MTTDNKTDKKTGSPVVLAGYIVGLTVLYVLSIGPVPLLVELEVLPDWIDWDVIEFFYAPIFWLCDISPELVQKVINWYLELWWGGPL